MKGLTAVYEAARENRRMRRISIYLDFMHMSEFISLAVQYLLSQLDYFAQRVKCVDSIDRA